LLVPALAASLTGLLRPLRGALGPQSGGGAGEVPQATRAAQEATTRGSAPSNPGTPRAVPAGRGGHPSLPLARPEAPPHFRRDAALAALAVVAALVAHAATTPALVDAVARTAPSV